jgi:PIN domain nuclease of toxin-antitoxin system
MTAPERLRSAAYDLIADPENQAFVSAASIWEMSIKHHAGKWPEIGGILTNIDGELRNAGFAALAIDVAHARTAGFLTGPHRDPFDRLLIAQARLEDLVVLTADRVFAAYGVATFWVA